MRLINILLLLLLINSLGLLKSNIFLETAFVYYLENFYCNFIYGIDL